MDLGRRHHALERSLTQSLREISHFQDDVEDELTKFQDHQKVGNGGAAVREVLPDAKRLVVRLFGELSRGIGDVTQSCDDLLRFHSEALDQIATETSVVDQSLAVVSDGVKPRVGMVTYPMKLHRPTRKYERLRPDEIAARARFRNGARRENPLPSMSFTQNSRSHRKWQELLAIENANAGVVASSGDMHAAGPRAGQPRPSLPRNMSKGKRRESSRPVRSATSTAGTPRSRPRSASSSKKSDFHPDPDGFHAPPPPSLTPLATRRAPSTMSDSASAYSGPAAPSLQRVRSLSGSNAGPPSRRARGHARAVSAGAPRSFAEYRVTLTRRPFNMSLEQKQLKVRTVAEGSEAFAGGIRPGDQVIAVKGQPATLQLLGTDLPMTLQMKRGIQMTAESF